MANNSGRWVWDSAENRLVLYSEYHAKKAAERNPAAFYMSDISPFQSPLDYSEISSRSALREHEKKHGVRQIGNDLKPQDYDVRQQRATSHMSDRAIEAAFRIAVEKHNL